MQIQSLKTLYLHFALRNLQSRMSKKSISNIYLGFKIGFLQRYSLKMLS
jgi:hypothetical protein